MLPIKGHLVPKLPERRPQGDSGFADVQLTSMYPKLHIVVTLIRTSHDSFRLEQPVLFLDKR